MPYYMVELTHTSGDCVDALEEIDQRSEDLLGEIYWGCMDGRHVGWTVVETHDEAEARETVQPSIRNKVTVTQVDVVSPELVRAINPESANPADEGPFTADLPRPPDENAS